MERIYEKRGESENFGDMFQNETRKRQEESRMPSSKWDGVIARMARHESEGIPAASATSTSSTTTTAGWKQDHVIFGGWPKELPNETRLELAHKAVDKHYCKQPRCSLYLAPLHIRTPPTSEGRRKRTPGQQGDSDHTEENPKQYSGAMLCDDKNNTRCRTTTTRQHDISLRHHGEHPERQHNSEPPHQAPTRQLRLLQRHKPPSSTSRAD